MATITMLLKMHRMLQLTKLVQLYATSITSDTFANTVIPPQLEGLDVLDFILSTPQNIMKITVAPMLGLCSS